MKFSSLAGALVAASLLGCGGGVDVTYRRTPGEVRNYLRTTDVRGISPAKGVQGRVFMEVTTRETTIEARRRDATGIDLEVRRLLVEIYGEGKDPLLRMDSDVPEAPIAAVRTPETTADNFAFSLSPLRLLIGTHVEIEQAITGQVAKPTGVDEIRARILAAFPEGDPRHDFVQGHPWEKFYVDALRPAICVPRGSAIVGDTVKFLDEKPLPDTIGTRGLMYYSGTAGLAKVENGIARMEMAADVFLDPLSPNSDPWPREYASRRRFLRLVKGTCKAWAKIDVATGALIEDEHVTELDLYFIKPDGTGEIPIPTTVTLRSKKIP